MNNQTTNNTIIRQDDNYYYNPALTGIIIFTIWILITGLSCYVLHLVSNYYESRRESNAQFEMQRQGYSNRMTVKTGQV